MGTTRGVTYAWSTVWGLYAVNHKYGQQVLEEHEYARYTHTWCAASDDAGPRSIGLRTPGDEADIVSKFGRDSNTDLMDNPRALLGFPFLLSSGLAEVSK